MYEYHIIHRENQQIEIIFGYDYADACRRHHIDPKDWFVQIAEYID